MIALSLSLPQQSPFFGCSRLTHPAFTPSLFLFLLPLSLSLSLSFSCLNPPGPAAAARANLWRRLRPPHAPRYPGRVTAAATLATSPFFRFFKRSAAAAPQPRSPALGGRFPRSGPRTVGSIATHKAVCLFIQKNKKAAAGGGRDGVTLNSGEGRPTTFRLVFPLSSLVPSVRCGRRPVRCAEIRHGYLPSSTHASPINKTAPRRENSLVR